MSGELIALMGTAAVIGFVHTILGPDHYIPFTMMSCARRWSLKRTAIVTILCGIGHVGSSVVLGLLGIALLVAVERLEVFESVRGDLAAWAFLAFGVVYFVWGVRRAIRNRPHEHRHMHDNGSTHDHEHSHTAEHSHVHDQKAAAKSITPWALFVVFVLGPCEPLIPILMYPAAAKSGFGLAMVTTTFAVVTIGTMLAAVLVTTLGVSLLPLKRLERYAHALAGASICACGAAILCGL